MSSLDGALPTNAERDFQHRRLLPWSLAKRALCLSKIEGVTYGALVRFQPDGGPV